MKNMDFRPFQQAMENHFEKNMKNEEYLFTIKVNKRSLWENYLKAFPDIIRNEYRCYHCRDFINKVGNIVAINKEGKITTLWDFKTGNKVFDEVAKRMKKYLSNKDIEERFLTNQEVIGSKHETDLENDYYHFEINTGKFCVQQSKRKYIKRKDAFLQKKFSLFMKHVNDESIKDAIDICESGITNTPKEEISLLKDLIELQEQLLLIKELDRNRLEWFYYVRKGEELNKIYDSKLGELVLNLKDNSIEHCLRIYQ